MKLKYMNVVGGFLIAASVAVLLLHEPVKLEKENILHTVQPGETVWTICGHYASKWDNVNEMSSWALSENRIVNAGLLQPGRVIVVRRSVEVKE